MRRARGERVRQQRSRSTVASLRATWNRSQDAEHATFLASPKVTLSLTGAVGHCFRTAGRAGFGHGRRAENRRAPHPCSQVALAAARRTRRPHAASRRRSRTSGGVDAMASSLRSTGTTLVPGRIQATAAVDLRQERLHTSHSTLVTDQTTKDSAMATVHSSLTDLLDPLGNCMTPEVARKVVQL
jgi:hypothetical protein